MNSMVAMDTGRASQQGPENTHETASYATYDASYAAAYEAAKELATSYTDLLLLKESYKEKLGGCPHYTMDDVYYLLTQGAHGQTERVKTSGTSDPVFRAAMNAEKTLRRLNAELDAEYQREVVKPYMDICEKVHLFEICMNSLGRSQLYIADQLYVQKLPAKEIMDAHGKKISRRRLAQEEESILLRFTEVLEQYMGYCSRCGQPLPDVGRQSGGSDDAE